MLALVLAIAPVQSTALPAPRTVVADCGGPLKALAADPREKRAFTIDRKGVLTAWDLATGTAAWSHAEEGQHALACGAKALLVVWTIPVVSTFDPASGERTSSLGGPPPYTGTAGFASDSDGRWAWVGQERGLIRITPGDVNGWSRRALDCGGVTTLALDAGDDLLAVGGKDGTIRFANCKSANVDDKKVFEGHTGPITALAFLPKALASASEDGSVRVWTLSSGKVKHELQGAGPVVGVLAAEKSGTLAAADGAGTLIVWDAAKGAERGRWTSPNGTPLAALVFSAKGETLLAAHGSQLLAFDLQGK